MVDYTNVFSWSPNPACIVQTASVQNAYYKIRFCIRAKQGLSLILGDNGVGKSSLSRSLYSEINERKDMTAAMIPTPRAKTDLSFLKSICDEFGVVRKRSHIDQAAEFERFLLAETDAGRTVVLFIDEAQLLTAECLEVIRALLNFETSTHKLIQIVLAGQLSLGERLMLKRSKAIKSRIFAPSLINSLTLEETRQLIKERCKYWQVPNPFDAATMDRIFIRTEGVPRYVLALAAMTVDLSQTANRPIAPDLVDVVADDLVVKVHNEDEAGSEDEREAAQTTHV